ncbi:hypothetical protein QYF61_021053 [Mycteria americana]|uniref:Uncharacterized protein n=1 Tax=Mycteria americana TaxID=33587 RepID=A0AAN7Q700_MYCAM|nr:hypothetical protein QYF61_021053 [Mycteria americana]
MILKVFSNLYDSVINPLSNTMACHSPAKELKDRHTIIAFSQPMYNRDIDKLERFQGRATKRRGAGGCDVQQKLRALGLFSWREEGKVSDIKPHREGKHIFPVKSILCAKHMLTKLSVPLPVYLGIALNLGETAKPNNAARAKRNRLRTEK